MFLKLKIARKATRTRFSVSSPRPTPQRSGGALWDLWVLPPQAHVLSQTRHEGLQSSSPVGVPSPGCTPLCHVHAWWLSSHQGEMTVWSQGRNWCKGLSEAYGAGHRAPLAPAEAPHCPYTLRSWLRWQACGRRKPKTPEKTEPRKRHPGNHLPSPVHEHAWNSPNAFLWNVNSLSFQVHFSACIPYLVYYQSKFSLCL